MLVRRAGVAVRHLRAAPGAAGGGGHPHAASSWSTLPPPTTASSATWRWPCTCSCSTTAGRARAGRSARPAAGAAARAARPSLAPGARRSRRRRPRLPSRWLSLEPWRALAAVGLTAHLAHLAAGGAGAVRAAGALADAPAAGRPAVRAAAPGQHLPPVRLGHPRADRAADRGPSRRGVARRRTCATSPAIPRARPPFVAPHQPRVDFLLWFHGLAWRRTPAVPGRRCWTALCHDPAAVAPLFARPLPDAPAGGAGGLPALPLRHAREPGAATGTYWLRAVRGDSGRKFRAIDKRLGRLGRATHAQGIARHPVPDGVPRPARVRPGGAVPAGRGPRPGRQRLRGHPGGGVVLG